MNVETLVRETLKIPFEFANSTFAVINHRLNFDKLEILNSVSIARKHNFRRMKLKMPNTHKFAINLIIF